MSNKTIVNDLRSASIVSSAWCDLMCDAADRITELEAEVTSLTLIEQNLLRYCRDHKTRITELEAINKENGDHAEELAKQLDKVRGLKTYDGHIYDNKLRVPVMVVRYDELQQALEDEDELCTATKTG